ncbi:carboxylate--amine ligase [Paeniglutamicibacter sp. R2-26]|uniref:carboxylate--amine ligase n=1 Tax=Paeniglutamicibacter sp. R2-26 TaxID=3144417 RepID=UPI003EE79D51
MSIPVSQSFVPVILGGDIGTYSLAREFHEAYGVTSVGVPAGGNGIIENSVALDLRPAGSILDEDNVVAHLLALGRELTSEGRNPRPLLLCGSLDLHVMLITRRREELEAYFTIPYVELETMESAALKENFYALCQQLGIPHPVTVAYDPATDPASLPGDLPFPLIGKPSDSSAWISAKFEGKQKIHTINSRAELDDLLGKIQASGYGESYVLQELIAGGDSNMRLCTFFSSQEGRVEFAGYGEVVVEEHSPLVLGNSAAIVTAVDDTVIEHGRRLLEHLGWTGFSMFDAKLDPRDGVIKFFELNPRLGRNHYYLTAAGANAARFYVREYLGAEFDNTVLDPSIVDTNEHGVKVLNVEHLYTVLPHALLRRFLGTEVGAKAAALLKAGKVSNPLRYRAEKHPKRQLFLLLNAVNHYRKYKAFPPRQP